MARFPKKVLNTKSFKRCIFYCFDDLIVHYGNTKHFEIYLDFTKDFFCIVDI